MFRCHFVHTLYEDLNDLKSQDLMTITVISMWLQNVLRNPLWIISSYFGFDYKNCTTNVETFQQCYFDELWTMIRTHKKCYSWMQTINSWIVLRLCRVTYRIPKPIILFIRRRNVYGLLLWTKIQLRKYHFNSILSKSKLISCFIPSVSRFNKTVKIWKWYL